MNGTRSLYVSSHGFLTPPPSFSLSLSVRTRYIMVISLPFRSRFRLPPSHAEQLQLSPSCDARPLLVTSESNIVPEIQRVAQGVLNQASKVKRREYYKQASHLITLTTYISADCYDGDPCTSSCPQPNLVRN